MRIWPSQARARCLKGVSTELLDPRLGGRIGCALLTLSAFFSFSCSQASAPGHRVISAVDIRGDTTGDEAELRRGIATRKDASYDPSTLAKDLERIQGLLDE